MRRLAAMCAAAALLAGCGGQDRPAPGQATVAEPAAPQITRAGDLAVRTDRQFAVGAWTGGGAAGRLWTVVVDGTERTPTRRFDLRLDREVSGDVTLLVRTYAPGAEDTVLAATAANGRLSNLRAAPAGAPAPALDPREPGVPATTGRTWHVAPTGADTAEGTDAAPLATADEALRRAAGGDEIVLARGTYPAIADDRTRDAAVTIRAAGPERPAVAGAYLAGTRLAIRGLRFTEAVQIGRPREGGAAQIELRDNDISSASGAPCIRYRGGTTDLRVLYNHLHDCGAGIGGVPSEGPSRDVVVHGNLIERVQGDGLQIGTTRNLTIDRNVIRRMGSRGEPIHNDGIQFLGGVRSARITRNILARSDDQLIMIKNDTPELNADILISDNLVLGGGVAIQAWGTKDLRVRRTTSWDNVDGGFIVGPGGDRARRGPPSAATTLEDNVFDGVFVRPGGRIDQQARNVVAATPAERRRVARAFADARAGDFQAARRALPRGAIPPTGPEDLYGVPRGPAAPAGALA